MRIIDARVESWDLAQLGLANVTPATAGRPSYAAKDMLKLYTYGSFSGIRSASLARLPQEATFIVTG